jgi:hypothetical protein
VHHRQNSLRHAYRGLTPAGLDHDHELPADPGSLGKEVLRHAMLGSKLPDNCTDVFTHLASG